MVCRLYKFKWRETLNNRMKLIIFLVTIFTLLGANAEVLLHFDFNKGLTHDLVEGSDPQSLWAIPVNSRTGFIADIDGDDAYTLKNDGTKPTFYGGSYGNANRSEWGLTYNESDFGNALAIGGDKKGNIREGFNVSQGKFTIMVNLVNWRLTSDSNAAIVFKARNANNETITGFKISGNSKQGHTLLNGFSYDPRNPNGSNINFIPGQGKGPGGSNKWSMNRIKSDSLSGELGDLSGPIGITVDLDENKYVLFANGHQYEIDAPHNLGEVVIDKVRLSTSNFSAPSFITIDEVKVIAQ